MTHDAFAQPFRETRLACPNCSVALVEIERSHIMIDACPQCRGVWLDRGELDRLLERERQALVSSPNPDRDFIDEMRGMSSPAAPAPGTPTAAPPLRPGERDPYGERHGRDRYGRHDDDDDSDERGSWGRGDYRKGRGHRKKRSLGMLEDLFDF